MPRKSKAEREADAIEKAAAEVIEEIKKASDQPTEAAAEGTPDENTPDENQAPVENVVTTGAKEGLEPEVAEAMEKAVLTALEDGVNPFLIEGIPVDLVSEVVLREAMEARKPEPVPDAPSGPIRDPEFLKKNRKDLGTFAHRS